MIALPHIESLAALKAGAVGTLVVGAGALAFTSLRNPESFSRRSLDRYIRHLERGFAAMFVRIDVRAVVIGQAIATYALVAIAVWQHEARVLGAAPLLLVLPAFVLESMRKRRIAKIEAQSDAFVLALANALHSTPSVGDAFRSIPKVVDEPLRSEVTLATKHMRLGCTLEEALSSMAGRINSRAFDTALAAVLIGQRLGGNVPATLQSVGAAIRELHRLDRMSRSRLSSMRSQLWIIAATPFAFSYLMEQIMPGFFEPLGTSHWGIIAIAAAIGCWVGALLLARKILAVSL